MLKFINAKINLGLNIVGRMPDGYHLLETIFIPVGKYNGTPDCPYPFCDILEIIPSECGQDSLELRGNVIDCAPDDNIVSKAVKILKKNIPADFKWPGYKIILFKNIPFGAGLGGGSADATVTLKILNELSGNIFSNEILAEMALKLGADCPFFLINEPCFAKGIGEQLEKTETHLTGKWALLAKPSFSVSTKEAFAGINPCRSEINLKDAVQHPITEWKNLISNDFETTIFQKYPLLGKIKKQFYDSGAIYASMSGSGSTVYGIYDTEQSTLQAKKGFESKFGNMYYAVVKL